MEASYKITPLTFAGGNMLKWLMIRTPEGSSMWWWQDQQTLEEHALVFESDAAMQNALQRKNEECGHRFKPTPNRSEAMQLIAK